LLTVADRSIQTYRSQLTLFGRVASLRRFVIKSSRGLIEHIRILRPLLISYTSFTTLITSTYQTILNPLAQANKLEDYIYHKYAGTQFEGRSERERSVLPSLTSLTDGAHVEV
jgi:hypothetical protein